MFPKIIKLQDIDVQEFGTSLDELWGQLQECSATARYSNNVRQKSRQCHAYSRHHRYGCQDKLEQACRRKLQVFILECSNQERGPRHKDRNRGESWFYYLKLLLHYCNIYYYHLSAAFSFPAVFLLMQIQRKLWLYRPIIYSTKKTDRQVGR